MECETDDQMKSGSTRSSENIRWHPFNRQPKMCIESHKFMWIDIRGAQKRFYKRRTRVGSQSARRIALASEITNAIAFDKQARRIATRASYEPVQGSWKIRRFQMFSRYCATVRDDATIQCYCTETLHSARGNGVSFE